MTNSYKEEQDYIFTRVNDLFSIAYNKERVVFSPFWNECQIAFAKQKIDSDHLKNYIFFGGHEESERKILGVFPSYTKPDKNMFPIASFSFLVPKGYQISHRDVLGALTSLNISRDHIGDILVSDDYGVFHLKESVSTVVRQELHKIGRVGIKLNDGADYEILPKRRFKDITGAVASLRFDAVVALIAKCSREKASEKIKSGLVSINYLPVIVPKKNISPGDLITIRGIGKFKIDDCISYTKKGRRFLTIHQFV